MFQSRSIRSEFLKILKKYLKKFSITCYTYSFTVNHYYLVLRSTEEAVSIFMQQLNNTFARRFNHLQDRHDAVLGRRFDSIVAKDEIALTDLIRYVNLEPVRQNLCTLDELDTSALSAHRFILSKKRRSFIERKSILNQFKSADQKGAYREFIRSGYPDNEDDEILKLIREGNCGKGEQIILGDSKYIEETLQINRNIHTQIKRHISENVAIGKIHQKVNEFLFLEKEELFSQGRENVKSTARELFAYIAKRRFDFSNAEIGRYLRVCRSAVTRMVSRFEKIAQRDFLKNEIEWLCAERAEAVPI